MSEAKLLSLREAMHSANIITIGEENYAIRKIFTENCDLGYKGVCISLISESERLEVDFTYDAMFNFYRRGELSFYEIIKVKLETIR